MTTLNKIPNKLVNEKSPYLQQHAYNPVHWFPWGDEAFQKAKTENKPIFLSIGYSTCHWCHVMETESFEDLDVARILNENYISIKVDRELRPDIDNIYMRVCQGMTGSGGWPMSVFMTPEQKPFFAGTYFPKQSAGQYSGFIDIITHFAEAWKENKNQFFEDTAQIEAFLKQSMDKHSEELKQSVIQSAFEELKSQYDPLYGGSGIAPKFPTPHKLFFLLRYYKSASDRTALDMVEHTLLSMYKGGIFDHIGYGFSRYSTDRKWLVPHIEKMLYDNALLAIAYTECYACTKNELYKNIAEKIFTYVLRDLTSSDGAFYSSEDADSEGMEGKYYVWSYKELFKQFNKNKVEILCNYLGVTKEGNFEGANIINLIHTDLETVNQPEIKKAVEEIRSKLYDERLKRIRPFKDTKVLISWNGMMIAALAIGGRVLHRRDYIVAAKKAAGFILGSMTDQKNRLLNGYKNGINSAVGYLDDYAYIIFGFIELYRSTFDTSYLNKALEFNQTLIDNFWDNQQSGFFFYGNDQENLIIRPKEHYDGATPSGNSIAAMNLLQLYEYTGDHNFKVRAEKLINAFGADINSQPTGHIHFLTAFLTNNQNKSQVIFTGRDKNELLKIRQKLDSNFLPFTTCLVYDGNEAAVETNPHLKDYIPEDRVTAYVCENFTCQQPTHNIDAVFTNLQ